MVGRATTTANGAIREPVILDESDGGQPEGHGEGGHPGEVHGEQGLVDGEKGHRYLLSKLPGCRHAAGVAAVCALLLQKCVPCGGQGQEALREGRRKIIFVVIVFGAPKKGIVYGTSWFSHG